MGTGDLPCTFCVVTVCLSYQVVAPIKCCVSWHLDLNEIPMLMCGMLRLGESLFISSSACTIAYGSPGVVVAGAFGSDFVRSRSDWLRREWKCYEAR